MTRLTDRRIAHLCRQAAKGWEGDTLNAMAARWGVTTRHLRRVVQTYRETGVVPKLNPRRRPRDPPLTREEEALIEKARRETRRGVVKVWRWLEKNGTPIPKNKVESYAKKQGWQQANPNKQKKRNRTRYERPFTGDLLHGDWHRSTENHPHCIVWMDDASRKVLGFGEFTRISAQASIATFQTAQTELAKHGVRVHQVNTDQGSEFYASRQQDKEQGISQFTQHLHAQGIAHIPSRPRNPQTNGKLERFWLEYDRHRWRFPSLTKFIAWSNRQIHEELWIDRNRGIWETPDEASTRKFPPETTLLLHECLATRNGTTSPLTVEVIYGT